MALVQEALEAQQAVEITPEEAAEDMACGVLENLAAFQNGERTYFDAHFPLNLGERDAETGKGTSVTDRAHAMFLDVVGVAEAGEGFIVTSDNVKLNVREVTMNVEVDGLQVDLPIHITYSSETLY